MLLSAASLSRYTSGLAMQPDLALHQCSHINLLLKLDQNSDLEVRSIFLVTLDTLRFSWENWGFMSFEFLFFFSYFLIFPPLFMKSALWFQCPAISHDTARQKAELREGHFSHLSQITSDYTEAQGTWCGVNATVLRTLSTRRWLDSLNFSHL